MPEALSDDDIQTALAAVQFAVRVREYHARRTDKRSPQRAIDIDQALTKLKDAMRPIRSERARLAFKPATSQNEDYRLKLEACSESIQRERRKLWKLRDQGKKKKTRRRK